MFRAARDEGLIGTGSLDAHISHSLGFARSIGTAPRAAADLGSGGGLPGLVLALVWPDSDWRLVEASERRAGFLEGAVRSLGLGERVRVDPRRAEVVGRDPAVRGGADLVCARAFGAPAVVGESAAPLMGPGARLVVSGKPTEASVGRWQAEGLGELGLAAERCVRVRGAWYRVLRQKSPCPDRYPRRPGTPERRPLF